MAFSAGVKYTMGPVTVLTDDYTATVADSGTVFIMNAADKTVTLPSTAAGLTYTIVSGTTAVASGSTGTSISPAAADGLSGGTVNKDLVNTAGTDIVGDFCTVVGSGTAGTTAWAAFCGGIWAAEA